MVSHVFPTASSQRGNHAEAPSSLSSAELVELVCVLCPVCTFILLVAFDRVAAQWWTNVFMAFYMALYNALLQIESL